MSWTWRLEWGEITPTVVIGSCPMTVKDLHRIHAETGVSAVLSVQHDDCHAYWSIDYAAMSQAAEDAGLLMARYPIRDFDVDDMRRQLPDAVSALSAFQIENHRTYVHCTAGLGRAPLVVLGYLILVEQRDPEQAIRTLLNGRPGAVPAWEALHGARQDLSSRFREAIESRAYELHQERGGADPDANWLQAEAEIIQAKLNGHVLD